MLSNYFSLFSLFLQATSSSGATATDAPGLEKEEIAASLPSPVKMPRSSSSFTISEDDFSDLSFLPSISGDGSDDLPLP